MTSKTRGVNCSPIAKECQAERLNTFLQSSTSSTFIPSPSSFILSATMGNYCATKKQGRTAETDSQKGSTLLPVHWRHTIHHTEAQKRFDLPGGLQVQGRSCIPLKIQQIHRPSRLLRPKRFRRSWHCMAEGRNWSIRRINHELYLQSLPPWIQHPKHLIKHQ